MTPYTPSGISPLPWEVDWKCPTDPDTPGSFMLFRTLRKKGPVTEIQGLGWFWADKTLSEAERLANAAHLLYAANMLPRLCEALAVLTCYRQDAIYGAEEHGEGVMPIEADFDRAEGLLEECREMGD